MEDQLALIDDEQYETGMELVSQDGTVDSITMMDDVAQHKVEELNQEKKRLMILDQCKEMKLRAQEAQEELTRIANRTRDPATQSCLRARAKALEEHKKIIARWRDSALREWFDVALLASMANEITRVIMIIQNPATDEVYLSRSFVTGGSTLLNKNGAQIPATHSGKGLKRYTYPWVAGATTITTTTEEDILLHKRMIVSLKDWDYLFDIEKVRMNCVTRTKLVELLNCESFIICDDSVGVMTRNGYLSASCAQLVIPGATTCQLMNMVHYLVDNKYLALCQRIVVIGVPTNLCRCCEQTRCL